MDREAVRRWCLSRPGSREETPFGPSALVYKVGGKLFAILTPEGAPASVSLKCEPRFAEHLRATYPAVSPGYHLNKRHWNTVELNGEVPAAEIREMLGHSYTLVLDSLPSAVRRSLRGSE